MALKPEDKANFGTLVRAAKNDDLGLIECRCAKTGAYRAVIMANNHNSRSNDIEIMPFGHLATGDPIEQYVPPDTEYDFEQVDDEYPLEDWMLEVSEEATRLGYGDWVEHKRASN